MKSQQSFFKKGQGQGQGQSKPGAPATGRGKGKSSTKAVPAPQKPNCRTNPDYKSAIANAAYIGQKGYTIPKTALDPDDLAQLKKDLFMTPKVNFSAGPPSAAAAAATSFSVYRENTAKIYIPRFYGIEQYGLPNRTDIQQGIPIDLAFTKELRDYQTNIIQTYMNYANTPVAVGSEIRGNGAILEVPCGRGKTVMALKIISEVRLKTLILVHKEFLMNQWIDRIAEFLSGARIGRIQGSLFDVDDKDIVIGMIQTIHSRDFAPAAFEGFGFTIIDEVHRIGSEEFSKSLFKTITPYMLGISATVDRKDNMTDILYKFIGPKIYSEERANDDPVCVRAIEYRSNNDTVFDETEYDYRGMPKYSTMISKLSEYGPRSDFIVRVLGDLLQENPENQIMILGHNRSLLEYLYAAVGNRLPNTTVGYYVGGMKQAELQETENRQVVLATYAMAAEALDIKTLSTLIMATPKTDIEQSVGRILRVKHAQPIVVDIVDSHELFKRQFQQRKMFYRKCQYDIYWTSSNRYTNMFQNDWKNPDNRVWTADKSRFSNKNANPRNEIIGKGQCMIPKELAVLLDREPL